MDNLHPMYQPECKPTKEQLAAAVHDGEMVVPKEYVSEWTPEMRAHFRKLWEELHDPKPIRTRHGVGMEAIHARDRIHKLSEAIGLLFCVSFAMYGAWTVAKDLARWLVGG